MTKINNVNYTIIGSKDCFAYIDNDSYDPDLSKIGLEDSKNNCDFYEIFSYTLNELYFKKKHFNN